MKFIIFLFLGSLTITISAQPTERCEISMYVFDKDAHSIFKPKRILQDNCNVGHTYENKKYIIKISNKFKNESIGFCNRIDDFANTNYKIKDTTGIFTFNVNLNDSLCIQIIKKSKFGNKKMVIIFNKLDIIDTQYILYIPFKRKRIMITKEQVDLLVRENKISILPINLSKLFH